MAEVGHDVLCIDIDAAKIARLKQADIPIFEPGLQALVKENAGAGRLSFSTDAQAGVPPAEVPFIALRPPPAGHGAD